MPRFKLILTSDYEVWGNGSGCVHNCVIKPAELMMSIAEKYDAKITFFFDVCEYWAFEEVERKGLFQNDYKPALAMRNQLRKAIQKGHDVQLHFHPQWLNYKFLSNYNWELDFRYWQLPEVENYHSEEWNIDRLFKKGIKTLNELFRDIKDDYKVHAFRAGAWCIQPSEKVIQALNENDIKIDSTVMPNTKFDNGLTKYNFKNTPLTPFWYVGSEDVTMSTDKSDLKELPISVAQLSFFENILSNVLKISISKNSYPLGCQRKNDSNSRSKVEKLVELTKRLFFQRRMLNFSDGTSFYEMNKVLKKVMKQYESTELLSIPIVAISHPKSFGEKNSFSSFLSCVQSNDHIEFSTYESYLESNSKR